MLMPYQWDQGLADQLLVADPMPTLLQRVSKAVARQTDRVIREILCAKRPGWTMDQAKQNLRLLTLRTEGLKFETDVYWHESAGDLPVKLGSYRLTTESADGEIKIKSQIFLES
jgi:hypothetical protein